MGAGDLQKRQGARRDAVGALGAPELKRPLDRTSHLRERARDLLLPHLLGGAQQHLHRTRPAHLGEQADEMGGKRRHVAHDRAARACGGKIGHRVGKQDGCLRGLDEAAVAQARAVRVEQGEHDARRGIRRAFCPLGEGKQVFCHARQHAHGARVGAQRRKLPLVASVERIGDKQLALQVGAQAPTVAQKLPEAFDPCGRRHDVEPDAQVCVRRGATADVALGRRRHQQRDAPEALDGPGHELQLVACRHDARGVSHYLNRHDPPSSRELSVHSILHARVDTSPRNRVIWGRVRSNPPPNDPSARNGGARREFNCSSAAQKAAYLCSRSWSSSLMRMRRYPPWVPFRALETRLTVVDDAPVRACTST